MILCVAANAAVDKTVVIEGFRLNAVNRPSQEMVLAGGKACNVARAARTLGQPTLVTGWVGGTTGAWIEAALREEGIQTAFARTPAASRTCLSVVDPASQTTTEIYETGGAVTTEAVDALYGIYQTHVAQADWAVLSGSLPPGTPADFYAKLARAGQRAGAQVVIDSGGEALRRGLAEGQPVMVKCNRSELEELAGEPLDRLADIQRVLSSLEQTWGARMVVTLGSAGAVACVQGRIWLAQAPQIEKVSAVGSGDAFLAGLLHALLEKRPFSDALRLAVACGSANALQLGAGRLRMADVEALLPRVVVKEDIP